MYPFQNVLAIIINQIAVTINRTVKSAKEIVKKRMQEKRKPICLYTCSNSNDEYFRWQIFAASERGMVWNKSKQ